MPHSFFALFVSVFSIALAGPAQGAPVDESIVYQGQLLTGEDAFTGSADLRFRLFDALIGGTQVGPQIERAAEPVDQGLFSVELGFGSGVFGQAERYLEIDVRGPGDATYTTLSPRQRIAPAPVAIRALKPWSVEGTDAYFTGGFLGVGQPDPITPLHITNFSLNLDPSTIFQDDVLIEDADALFSLNSDQGGGAGSGLLLKEIDSNGLLSDMWGVYRRTSGAGSSLRFSYGDSSNYAANPTVLEIDPDGGLLVTGGIRTPTVTRTKVFSRYTAALSQGTGLANTAYTLAGGGFGKALIATELSSDGALFRLDLPDGAYVTSVEAHVLDADPTSNVSLAVWGQSWLTLGKSGLGNADTDGIPGDTVLAITFGGFGFQFQSDAEYYARVRIPFTGNENLQAFDLRVTYETFKIE